MSAGPAMSEIRSLTVLYDAECPLCTAVRGWLEHQALLVPLAFVPCGSAQARALLPDLDHATTSEEITVVADTGEVWTSEGAWIAVLWATADHRGLARWLSHPRRRGQARTAALAVARNRPRRRPSGGWVPPVHDDLGCEPCRTPA